MRKTTFAGFTVLEPGESVTEDGGSFLTRNPELADRLARIGAKTHRHDAHAALANPVTAPTVTTLNGGGTLAPDLTVSACYTLLDDDGGETLPSPVEAVTTEAPIAAPDAPTAAIDYTAGGLLIDAYGYVLTLVDGQGGETTPSEQTIVSRDAGTATAQVQITGLTAVLAARPGATGWRLYRAKGASDYEFLAAGATDTFTDDGTTPLDPGTNPPTANTTNAANLVIVNVPAAAIPAAAVAWRLYVSTDGTFISPALVGADRLPADAGTDIEIAAVTPLDGAPPDVSTSIGGAAPILATRDIDFTGYDFPSGGGGGAVYPQDWSMTLDADGGTGSTDNRSYGEAATVFLQFDTLPSGDQLPKAAIQVLTPADSTPWATEVNQDAAYLSNSDPGADHNPAWDRRGYLEFPDGPNMSRGSVTVRFQLAELPSAVGEHFDVLATIAIPRGPRYMALLSIPQTGDPLLQVFNAEPYFTDAFDQVNGATFAHAFAALTDLWLRLTRAADGTLTAEVFDVDPAGIGVTPIASVVGGPTEFVGAYDKYGWAFERQGGMPGCGFIFNGAHPDVIRFYEVSAHATAGGNGGTGFAPAPVPDNQPMIWRGAYNAAQFYTWGDVVSYSGVTYVSEDYNHSGNQPDISGSWVAIS